MLKCCNAINDIYGNILKWSSSEMINFTQVTAGWQRVCVYYGAIVITVSENSNKNVRMVMLCLVLVMWWWWMWCSGHFNTSPVLSHVLQLISGTIRRCMCSCTGEGRDPYLCVFYGPGVDCTPFGWTLHQYLLHLGHPLRPASFCIYEWLLWGMWPQWCCRLATAAAAAAAEGAWCERCVAACAARSTAAPASYRGVGRCSKAWSRSSGGIRFESHRLHTCSGSQEETDGLCSNTLAAWQLYTHTHTQCQERTRRQNTLKRLEHYPTHRRISHIFSLMCPNTIMCINVD